MIDGVFYMESQGNNERVVKSALEDLAAKLKREKGVTAKKTEIGEAVKEGDNFSSSLEAEVSFETLRDYFRTCMRYAPYAIVLDSPARLDIGSQEFLKILGELTAVTKRLKEKQHITVNIPEGTSGSRSGSDLEDRVGLDEDEIDALLDQGALRVKLVVQMKGAVDESRDNLLRAIGNAVYVHKIKASEVEEGSLVAVHAFMYEPKTLVELCIKLSPVYIEILEPKELELSMLDIQDIGLELAATYFDIAHLHLKGTSPY